jgi:hypothetical protein
VIQDPASLAGEERSYVGRNAGRKPVALPGELLYQAGIVLRHCPPLGGRYHQRRGILPRHAHPDQQDGDGAQPPRASPYRRRVLSSPFFKRVDVDGVLQGLPLNPISELSKAIITHTSHLCSY